MGCLDVVAISVYVGVKEANEPSKTLVCVVDWQQKEGSVMR
jgi:hypothetical protein